ncbi:MAG: hypothetical protein NTZ68_02025 [Candidatus Dependentiae bacterium]|nr:hypothetical protein [Candidatus Dependentiae bacterium]
MKKLLLCFAILGASSMSHSIDIEGVNGMIKSWVMYDVTGTKDIYVAYPTYPFSADNSISGAFEADLNSMSIKASLNKYAVVMNLSRRAIVTAIVISGGLYLAYKSYCGKKQKSKSDEEESI